MVVPLLNGGLAFAGKSGRDTANACETNAIETNVIAAAHFISRGLIKTRKAGKQFSAAPYYPNALRTTLFTRIQFCDSSFPIILHRRCHSLLIVRATRRAVWLKGYSTVQIVPSRSVRLNRNT